MKSAQKLSACLLVLLLTSCAGTGAGNFCSLAEAIIIDCKDQMVDGTAQQILELNKTGQRECGWKPEAHQCPAMK